LDQEIDGMAKGKQAQGWISSFFEASNEGMQGTKFSSFQVPKESWTQGL
jgi:hypothetical protein